MKKKYLVFFIFIIISLNLLAQNNTLPIEKLGDYSANFFDIQNLFYEHTKGQNTDSIEGWKQFKRWEWFWETRVLPDGTFPDYSIYRENFINFMNENLDKIAGNWTEVGPYTYPSNVMGMGRIKCIAFHPDNENIIYAGAPTGGLWQSNDGGENWFTNTDFIIDCGISAIAIDYTNPDIIYVGTGGGYNGKPGIGVMKSIDGGESWAILNESIGNHSVHKLIMHPTNPNILLATSYYGIYRTINGGENWAKTDISYEALVRSLIFHPTNPDIVYSSYNNKAFRSTDNGETWNLIRNFNGLIKLAISPLNPNYLYCMVKEDGFYKSTEKGEDFEKISDCNYETSIYPYRDFFSLFLYFSVLKVHPNNPDMIYFADQNFWRSLDGGITWTHQMPHIHVDFHAIEINSNNKFYISNDGGIYYSDNNCQSGHFISNGLGIQQMYRIGLNRFFQSYHLVTGCQDNGSHNYTVGLGWTNIAGGDGTECFSETTEIDDWTIIFDYTSWQYGNMYRQSQFDKRRKICSKDVTNETGTFITPFIKPTASSMFAGYHNIWRNTNALAQNYEDVENSWEKISNIDKGQCHLLEASAANNNILYAYYRGYNGFFYRTNNAFSENPTWTIINKPINEDIYIKDIETNPFNEDIVYVVQENKIWKSNNKGIEWFDISGDLCDIPINCIEINPQSDEGLYIGTDFGIFYKNANMENWVPFNAGLPPIIISDIEITDAHFTNNYIVVATYGRGVWKSEVACNTTEAIDLHISGTLESSFRHAESTITSDAFIPSGTNVTFRAGKSIRLTSGFHAKGNFRAYIEPCVEEKSIQIPNLPRNPYNKKNQNKLIIEKKTKNNDFIIYPNPANNYIIIKQRNQYVDIDKIEIINIFGKTILKKDNISTIDVLIDIINIPEGLYLVKIYTKNNNFTQKLIIH